jgi:S1-C subfamily serine protease
VVAEIMEHGRVRRSYFGCSVMMRPVSRLFQRETGFGLKTAVQAFQVMPDSPSARAGVSDGDYLLEIDGKAIGSVADVHRALPRPGATATLRVFRPGPGGAGGRSLTLPMTAEERPDVQQALARR